MPHEATGNGCLPRRGYLRHRSLRDRTSHYKARLARRRAEAAQTCDRAAFVRRNDKGMKLKETSVETRTSFRCQWEVNEDGAGSEVEFLLSGL